MQADASACGSERRRPYLASPANQPYWTRLYDRARLIGDSIRTAAGRALIRRNRIWWRSAAIAAAVPFLFCAGLAPGRAAGLDPAQMSVDEIKALEQRLTDAGCYKGMIDGTASGALDAAIKACPDQQPFLRVEVGVHTAQIGHIGVDAACRLVATASVDKTVRLWSLPEGKLQRVVRLPIAVDDGGRVAETAISPNGHLLAVGRDGHYLSDEISSVVYLFEIPKTGELMILHRMPFGSRVTKIAFSGDGERLAVGFKGPEGTGIVRGAQGVRVIDVRSGRELFADADYESDVFGLAFAPDGEFITSSFDGQLRRYGPDLKLTVKRPAPDGKHPYGVAIDPSGRRIAVSYERTPRVSILDARTLAPLALAETGDLNGGNFANVAWSHDGPTLVAGGDVSTQRGEWRQILRRFDADGRRLGADVDPTTGDDSIADIETCGEGFVFATAEPSFGLLPSHGIASTLQSPRNANMLGKVGMALTVSSDAASVRFGLGPADQKSVVFDLAAASLRDSPSLPSGFAPARVDGLPVTDWRNNHAPKFNGAPLVQKGPDITRALAVRPDASGFVLSSKFSVRAFDAKGEQRWNHVGPAGALGVDFSADGEILAVAYHDGTIRWLRWSDGEELLAFFVEPQTRKWVAWTPAGYYMASAGGEDLIGWQVNRGWDQEADFFPASQFRADYNRPDIVRLVLKTRDEAEAVRRANAASGRGNEAKPISAALPPVVAIASPKDGAHFSGDSVEIAYSLRSSSGLPIDRLAVLADGQPVLTAGFEKTNSPEAQGKVVATLPRKDTNVSLIAHSGDLTSAPASITLKYDGPTSAPSPTAADLLKPKLYALLVGVSGYTNPDYNTMHYGARDAESVAKVLEAQKGGLFADVQTKVVDDATQHNVFVGLEWLKGAAKSRDLAIVFWSGHGFLDNRQKFWFLTREADIQQLRATAVSKDDILGYVAELPGKKVLFIDACHAGAAMAAGSKAVDTSPDMNKLVNDFALKESGLVVFGASTGTEHAWENDQWDRHGAFTKALIEAIGEGKASTDGTGRITTTMLDLYVEERVKELTKGAQHPVMTRPDLLPDFPLALARP